MISSADEESLTVLLQRHAELESKHGDGDSGRFLSGWQCDNPQRDRIREFVQQESSGINVSEYLYFDRDPLVMDRIGRFHETVDGKTPSAVLCGLGATPIIFTFCAWLRARGIEEVFYIPPLYFSAHFALKILGIRARPVSGRHVFEPEFSFNLPSERSVLLLADPVWYAGVPVAKDLIEKLIEWQSHTGSFVFVDGSFQYARWDGNRNEPSARFDPECTVRVVCPTKPLATHGYRFAYALLPKSMYEKCAHIYASIYGSTSADNLAFARAAPLLLLEGNITNSLMGLASARHRMLRARGAISAPWEPTCGYFIFEEIAVPLPEGILLMDGTFFDQGRYPDFRRINLLSPSIKMLD
jgi:aspartate/methionine/tyrosine aminotransferase